jgi:D-alanine-D-alanine ligase
MAEKLKVAVLTGGISRERDVSFQSGRLVIDALEKAGQKVVSFDIQPDNLGILDDGSIDVFFPAIHGEFGEDGQLQEILEEKGLCFTGSGPEASRTAFDKAACKKALEDTDIILPKDVFVTSSDDIESLTEKISSLGDMVVVKPLSDGSSFGVQIVETAEVAAKAAARTFQEFGSCMVEEFVSGREITVGILNGKTLPIIEIRSKAGFYDYQAKYVSDSTEYLFDTIDDNGLVSRINSIALESFNVIGCRHFGRVDMILSNAGVPYFLEINTLPGFTSHSLFPKAANEAGLFNSQLCMKIIKAAMKDFNRKGVS